MKRRKFLKTALLGTVAAAMEIPAVSLRAKAVTEDKGKPDPEPCDLVAVMGGEPAQLYAAAVKEMGGLGRYVKKGQRVCIKPNIGWDRTPEWGANTNPQLVAAVVRDCLACGAAEVVVFDHTCDEWKACYAHSGIQEAVEAAGGRMAFSHEEKYYRTTRLPLAKNLKEPKIHEAVLDCDVWINMPVLKHHGGAKMTICMKNYMGMVWDRRFLHANNLQQCIADAATYAKRPALNIVDAYRIMTQNGPKGKGEDDVQMPKALFMSADIVATDTAATQFFSQFRPVTVAAVEHIGLAAQHGLGTMRLDTMNIKRIKL